MNKKTKDTTKDQKHACKPTTKARLGSITIILFHLLCKKAQTKPKVDSFLLKGEAFTSLQRTDSRPKGNCLALATTTSGSLYSITSDITNPAKINFFTAQTNDGGSSPLNKKIRAALDLSDTEIFAILTEKDWEDVHFQVFTADARDPSGQNYYIKTKTSSDVGRLGGLLQNMKSDVYHISSIRIKNTEDRLISVVCGGFAHFRYTKSTG